MKPAQPIIVLGTSVLLILLAFSFHVDFLAFSMAQFEGVSFSTNIFGSISTPFRLITAIAFIPVFYFVLHRITTIKTISQTILFLALTILLGILFWIFRLNYLTGVIQHFEIDPTIQQTMNASKLQLELFCWLGFLFGALLSFVILKLMNRKKLANDI